MSSKYTPGPWALAEAVEGKFTKTKLRRIRSVHEGMEYGAVCEVYGVADGTEAAANARLIAAAPDLLNIADRIVKALHLCGYSPVADSNNHAEALMHDAMAAIARATGTEG